MKKSSFRETDEWRRGHSGERMVADLLRCDGWYVIPSYDYVSDEEQELAPKLQGDGACYVLPDLDVAKLGSRKWVEVKTKKEATFHRKTKRWEHGFSRRHLRHYMKVQEITGSKVCLFVYEETTGKILIGKLDDLLSHKREYDGHKMGRDGMVFFPREKFSMWKTVGARP